jgi:hypothetical protein
VDLPLSLHKGRSSPSVASRHLNIRVLQNQRKEVLAQSPREALFVARLRRLRAFYFMIT